LSGSVVSPIRIVVIAGVLGAAGGVLLSFHKQTLDDAELERIASAPDQLNAAAFPADAVPRKPLQSGPVHLTAVEGLPQYPHAFVRPLMTTPKDGGAEMNIAWFSTKDSADDVLQFYAKEIDAKHKTVVVHKFGPKSGYAAYLDGADRRLHMISVMGQPHETLVFASSSYPEKLLDGSRQATPGVPVIDGAENTVSFALGEAGGGRRLWMSTFKQRTLEGVCDAYKKALTADGWAVNEMSPPAPSEARLEARKSGDSLEVMIRRDAASNVAVYVSVSGA
jgi:hypothetical protein